MVPAVHETADRAAYRGPAAENSRYKWVALSNTSLGVFMSALDSSIIIISLPAIFRGIHLDPLAPENVSYLLWMIMGYLLVQAVFVVTLGRLGDMFGRVRMYNAGFVVFSGASIMLSFDPFDGGHGALWLILWRVVQALGGSMLTANSSAILTDAFPTTQRGLALGINQMAWLTGQFLGLVVGGVLSAWDWRAVFWVNVPIGIFGTVWAYLMLREVGERHRARIDWWGNLTFAAGGGLLLAGVTYGIQPYREHSMGWTRPLVLGALITGVVLLAAFVVIENQVAAPMFQVGLFKIRTFAAGSIATLATAISRGGLQFMLIIWLQGIWLPLHGYDYADTPFWAGIFLLPMSVGVLVAGPVSGLLSDRLGYRLFATTGALIASASFVGLIFLPIDFSYWLFALLIAVNGIGMGMYASPNAASVMTSVPAASRGSASGMRATFQNAGSSLSIGVFFSLLIAGLAGTLSGTLSHGLQQHGVPSTVAQQAGSLPPVATVFSAFLGVNPVQHILQPSGVLATLSPTDASTLTGRSFFPHLIEAPFHHGLVIVFIAAAGLGLIAALASSLRGPALRPVQAQGEAQLESAARTAASTGEEEEPELTTADA